MDEIDFTAGALWYVVFLYSTVCHEAAHAWAGLKLGDDTAYRGGQVSLDPIPHIRREPVGMVVFPLLTFFMNAQSGRTWMMGWASAPYDPQWALRNPRSAAWMALAGPAANLLLAIAAALVVRVGLAAGWFRAPRSFDFSSVVTAASDSPLLQMAAMFLSVMFALNILLMIFNLIPVPPFDGSAVPLLFLSGSAAESWQQFLWTPTAQIIGFIVAFKGFGYVFWPLLTKAVNILYLGHAAYA
jgi:Zn-dependent protease